MTSKSGPAKRAVSTEREAFVQRVAVEMAGGLYRVSQAGKLASSKGLLTDEQARRLVRAVHELEDAVSAAVASVKAPASEAVEAAHARVNRQIGVADDSTIAERAREREQ